MSSRRIRQIALIALTLMSAFSGSQSLAETPGKADERLHQRVGQLIMVGFFGTSTADPGFRRIMKALEQGTIGGVLFLSRNITSRTNVKAMVDQVRRCACRHAPLIAVDEEGGVVQRLGKPLGNSDVPSAAKASAEGEDYARQQYAKLARRVADVGFNMNLGPVVDLNRNRSNPVIGSLQRSFSDRPEVVSRYAAIFIEEHRKRGVLTALKHFPGHGSSTTDSHRTVADVAASWSAVELIPYRTLLSRGLVDAVLVGHLANRKKWGGVATQAGSRAIDRLLRTELGFDGVVLSDDLSMEALNSGAMRLSDTATSAVRAGVDIVIVSRLHDADGEADPATHVHRAIFDAVKSGEVRPSSILAAAKRIERLKLRLRARRT